MRNKAIQNLLQRGGAGNGFHQMTPQGKTAQVAQQIGNPSALLQQGTTMQIYDSIPLDGRTELTFFKNASSRQFPLTNMNQGNGMLTAGETMVILHAQIVFVTFDAETGAVDAIANLGSNLQFQQAEFFIMQANQQVLKNMKLLTWVEQYNKDALFQEYNVYHFDTLLTIMPLLPFQCTVTLPVGVTIADTYAQLILSGTGGIMSPKQNF